ncbi:MAG: hypothetical protein RL720_1089 [Actinomycetota bacterium]
MLSRSEGSVTAELAMVLPAIVLVLGVCLQAVGALGIQLTNAALARQAARELARGVDISLVGSSLAQANPQAELQHSIDEELVCVSLTQSTGVGPLSWLLSEVHVQECVLNAQ